MMFEDECDVIANFTDEALDELRTHARRMADVGLDVAKVFQRETERLQLNEDERTSLGVAAGDYFRRLVDNCGKDLSVR